MSKISLHNLLRLCYLSLRDTMRSRLSNASREGFNKALPEKVDIVYLWCDESDPIWVSKRLSAAKSCNFEGISQSVNPLDELKYSLRSIDKYFNQHEKLWLITDSQTPDWLNTEHPRIQLIFHDQLLAKKSPRPCFCALPIESLIHTIDGLSEYFVYFNDDLFLRHNSDVNDWFDKSGRPRMELGRWIMDVVEPQFQIQPEFQYRLNTDRLLAREFSREGRLHLKHRPRPLRKSLCIEAEKRFPEAFASTRSSQFLSEKMYALLHGVIPYMAYYEGKAVMNPPKVFRKDMYYWHNDLQYNRKTWNSIASHKDLAMCIQENKHTKLTDDAVKQFHEMMNFLYPDKSQYEL